MSGRQQRDVKSALAGLWYRPGSTRVGHGWASWKSINDGDSYRVSRLHDNPWCHTLPDGAEMHSTDVFSHPELGEYVINPRNGTRIKRPDPCTWCVGRARCGEYQCNQDEIVHRGQPSGLCVKHHRLAHRPSRRKVRVAVSSTEQATIGG